MATAGSAGKDRNLIVDESPVRSKKQKLAVGRKPAQVLTEALATTLCREHSTPGTTSDGLAVTITSDVSG
jgi:hypothetical protein